MKVTAPEFWRTEMTDCPFCAIALDSSLAVMVREWSDALAIEPLRPVVSGHMLVIPRAHVSDFMSDPAVSAETMRHAAWLAGRRPGAWNVITSAGRAATQTVDHLHLHLVPRRHGDGLALPWT